MKPLQRDADYCLPLLDIWNHVNAYYDVLQREP